MQLPLVLILLLLALLAVFGFAADLPYDAYREWEIAFDFAQRLDHATQLNMPGASVQTETAGGVALQAIFQHSNLVGPGVSTLVYDQVALPELAAGERLLFVFGIGFPDRLNPQPPFDGCGFSLEIAGVTVFSKDWAERQWDFHEVDLTDLAGQKVNVSFYVDRLATSNADWACWAQPRIYIVGRPRVLPEGPKSSLLLIDSLLAQEGPDRIVSVTENQAGAVVVATLDPGLDLPCQLSRLATDAGPAPVPMAPRLVVGEGPDPENHTFVKVLSQYGLADLQFLAFPPEVRGGVEVRIAKLPTGQQVIVATALAQSLPSRVFDLAGVFLGEASQLGLAPPTTDFGAAEFASAFEGERLQSVDDPYRSLLRSVSNSGTRLLDVGARENDFWYCWYPWKEERPESERNSEHIKYAEYRHIRTDYATPARSAPDFETNDDFEAWAGEGLRNAMAGSFNDYNTAPPVMWEPCFTHRWAKPLFQSWIDLKEAETGLPKYGMLTRNNNVDEYGEFGRIDFYGGTYAFGWPAVDRLYVWPLRSALRQLAPLFRANPEHFVSLEPNHEHEIAVQAEGTQGDYNLKMIEGFFQYLAERTGRDIEALRREYGAPFEGYFDAPRDWERGDWDAYSGDNPFFKAWIDYNRYIVNRRLAETYREALLAGFPPEAIKSHQIPDRYAIGGLAAFSSVTNRHTPIDYAMNAGVGYGYTRYGVWYQEQHNVQQGVWSSGFDQVLIGEYQALTPKVEDAYGQLRYIFDHGGQGTHCMVWPDDTFNATMAQALDQLLEEDPLRPGITGGVGQVRPFVEGDRRFNLVSLGTGPERTGLIKSVDAEGKWEGSVYVVPFHAHLEAEVLELAGDESGFSVGPLTGLDSGQQVEVTFEARATGSRGTITFNALAGSVPLEGLEATVQVGSNWKPVRYVLRVPLPFDNLVIQATCEGAELLAPLAVLETEQTTKVYTGKLDGQRHKGGVTFDIIPD